MILLPRPAGEAERLAALRAYAILDTPPEEAFDRIARLAATLLGVPIAMVSLIDEHRQWIKAKVGLKATEIPREGAFCAQAVLGGEVMHVPDASLDPRFARHPLVAGDPGLRFYAGAPLTVPGGERLGTVCALDLEPRALEPRHARALRDLAALAADELELRRVGREAEAARRQAEQAARAKADFLAVMSHEIRTPLTGVLGTADLLAATELPPREQRRVEAIRGCGRHLLAVLNDVLDFSRVEAGGLTLERVDLSVPELLERVRALAAPQAAERGLELIFGLDPSVPPAVRGDPTRLQQVLHNLVGNAIKFTPPGGRVAVRAGGRPEGEGRARLRFEVRDTGIGIPRGKQAGLFQAFAQADASTARHHGGTGLGLAISKRLVEAMGGAIALESAPGEGSLFWFEVPFEVGDAAAVATAQEQSVARPAGATSLRVLLAEDVGVNRELLAETLTRHGHAVACAADGAEAVALAARERFDVVLMDVRMPGMDGIEATGRIRALPAPAREVPILALTADAREEERRRCLAAGMDGCLAKPVAWPELLAALGQAAAAPRSTARAGAASPPPPPAPRAAPRGRSADLRQRFVEDAARSCERLRATPSTVTPEELLEEAHKLKGAAGLLGLPRIGAAAKEVETAARAGLDAAGPVERLAAAVAAAGGELPAGGGTSPAGR